MEEKKKPVKPKFNIYWIYGLIAVAFIAMTFLEPQENAKDLEPKKFQTILKDGDVERIVLVNEEFAEIFIKKDSLGKHKDLKGEGPHYKVQTGPADKFMEKVEELQEGISEEEHVVIEPEKRHDYLGDALSWLLPIIIIVAIWIFIFRRMSAGAGGGSQIFNIGKSKAQLFDKETQSKVNFNDVAGLDEAKVEIMEIVDFLKKPEKYTQLGGKIPKGALLVGPPGTGKTLLAKAVAGEANVPFFSISGSDFVEMFVGVGASRVRDLFRQAKTKAPCIVFIDEIDAIGRARGKNPNHGANDERENTLNQLLTEMDGFGTNSGVIILAATNRADILDKALMRAGRFDRQIHVELPELKEREAIFKVHIKPIKVADDVKVGFLAKQTPGFSGADIANICNEAALIAARHDHPKVTKQDFLDAVDRVIGGLEKKSKVVTRTEKTTIAYHEAGHATVSWLLEFANPLVKVTIIPRGKALGAAWYLPEERQITTKEQMLDEMCATLGGRASEEINFGKVSSGALNDLERVTKYAYAMVTYYGMSDKIGNISYYDSTGQTEFAFTRPYSEKTAELIDEQVKEIVEGQYSRALEILKANKDGLVNVAGRLLEKEVIFSDDLVDVFGERLFKTREEEIEFENNGKAKPEEIENKEETIVPNEENKQ